MKVVADQLKPISPEILIKSDHPNRLTKLMIDDFRQDPVLAVRQILQMELPPHQRMRLRGMWRSKFFLDDSGISTGKDATSAMCAAMRCILFPDWINTFLAKGIKQLVNINHEYFQKWYETKPFYRNEVKRIYAPQNVITVEYKNGSITKLMAAGWDRDAETLRSERWNEVFMNEWWTYGNLEAIERTAFGRVTRYHPGQDVEELKELCESHIVLMASAGFKWMPEYKIVEAWQKKIDNDSHLHGRQRWDYYDIPRKIRKLFTDEDVMSEMLDNLPPENALVEILGVWQHSSADFYDSFFINNCRSIGVPVELKKTTKHFHVAGIDVARNRDDFSIVVTRFSEKTYPEPVYCFRGNNMPMKIMSGMIHYVNQLFKICFMVMDAGGGGLYIAEKLQEPDQVILGKNTRVGPILTQRDAPVPDGQPILELFKWSKEYQRIYRYFVKEHPGSHCDDGLLDAAHTMLKSAFESRHIQLPITESYQISPETLQEMVSATKSEGDILNEKRIISENIDNMLSELVGIRRKTNPDGSYYVTKKGFYSWESLKKKDSAYALLYSYIAYIIFMYENFQDSDDDEIPLVHDDMFSNLDFHYNEEHEDSILYGDFE